MKDEKSKALLSKQKGKKKPSNSTKAVPLSKFQALQEELEETKIVNSGLRKKVIESDQLIRELVLSRGRSFDSYYKQYKTFYDGYKDLHKDYLELLHTEDQIKIAKNIEVINKTFKKLDHLIPETARQRDEELAKDSNYIGELPSGGIDIVTGKGGANE